MEILPFKTVYVVHIDAGVLDNDALMNDLFESELKNRGLYIRQISAEGKWDNGEPFYLTTYNHDDPVLFIELEVEASIESARSSSAIAWRTYYEGIYPQDEVDNGN